MASTVLLLTAATKYFYIVYLWLLNGLFQSLQSQTQNYLIIDRYAASRIKGLVKNQQN